MSANKNGSKWIWPITRLAIYIRDGFTCQYCLKDLRHKKPWHVTLDHVVPRDKGGSHKAFNLITACRDCNNRKGDRALEDFLGFSSREPLPDAVERVQNQLLSPINRDLARVLRK